MLQSLRRPPVGMFRVIVEDNGMDIAFILGDYDTKQEAYTFARSHCGTNRFVYVYNDSGVAIKHYGWIGSKV